MHASAERAGQHLHAMRGFTLIELIVTIVVTAIALTALGTGLLSANLRSTDPVIAMRAAALAQATLDDVLGMRFDENTAPGGATRCGETSQPACSASMGPDAGEARASFDDVDDWHGLEESPARDPSGMVRSGFDGYRVQISVRYADAGDALPASVAGNHVKRVDVLVLAPNGERLGFSAYRGNF